MSRMLKSLEKLGLVERERAEHDRREVVVILSEKGDKAVEAAARATMGNGCAEVAMARAAFGDGRKKGWTLKRGMVAVVNLEEALNKVRRGFRDRAQLVYAHCPYAHGWVPPRTVALQRTYENGLVDAERPERPPRSLPDWPGRGLPEERDTISEPFDEVWGVDEVMAFLSEA